MSIVAICSEHGPFPAEGFIGGSGSANIVITSSSVSCPRCGRTSAIVDGDYRLENEEVTPKVLRPTPAQLLRLRNALEWAAAITEHPETNVEDVARRVRKTAEKEAPGLTRMVDAVLGAKGSTAATWIGVMIALLAFITSGQNQTLNEELVRHLIEQVEQDDSDAIPSQDQESTTEIEPPIQPE